MLIEDLTGRDEDVSVHCFHRIQYRFKRQPDGRKVANVDSQEHIGWMIGSGNFREYVPEPEVKEEATEPAAPAVDEMEEWVKTWIRLPGRNFVGYIEDHGDKPKRLEKGQPADPNAKYGKEFVPGFVYQNIDKFNAAPKAVIEKAIAKWNRQVSELAELGHLDSPQRIWPGRIR